MELDALLSSNQKVMAPFAHNCSAITRTNKITCILHITKIRNLNNIVNFNNMQLQVI